MAFVVPTKKGSFEIRESRSTAAGPRSRTLASFKELTDETIEKARARAAKPPTASQPQLFFRKLVTPPVSTVPLP